MEDNYTNIQNKMQKLLSPLNIFLCLLEIVFLVFVAIALRDVLEEPGVVAEVKMDQSLIASGVEDEITRQSIEEVLYETISLNKSDHQNISISDTRIREGSSRSVYFDKISTEYNSFVVDIPSIRGSYKVYYEKPDKQTKTGALNERAVEVIVTRLDDVEEKVYEDFACVDKYNNLGHSVIVKEYIQYVDSEDFYAYIDEENLSQIEVVSRYYTHTSEQDAKYVEEVREFVKSLGISPDLFEYYIVPVDELEIL